MRENLVEKLKAYADLGAYAFHMPGHKRIGRDFLKNDITEIDGFDNLHDAHGVLRDEMDAAAEMYGAKETYFSVNGSTCALLAAVSAAVPRGGRILIERTCHMAVYHAAYLRELDVIYTDGDIGRESVSGRMMDPVDAIVITSPTYEGCMKDVRAWAEMAHENGAVLIVDEAHGAHLGFHPAFPESAVRCGADLVVQSTHKTLPAMTQTALLHNVSGRVSGRRLQFFMDIYETSSPSYVLMSSITSALSMVRERGDVLFGDYASRLRRVRKGLCALRHFTLAGGEEGVITREDELFPYAAGTRMDPGKLVIIPRERCGQKECDADLPRERCGQKECEADLPKERCGRKDYDAVWLYGVLRDEYRLQMEMCTDQYCLAMTSIADTDEGFERLVAAMREIDERVEREEETAPDAEVENSEGDQDLCGRAEDKCADPKNGAMACENANRDTEEDRAYKAIAVSCEPKEKDRVYKVPVVKCEDSGPQERDSAGRPPIKAMKISEALDSPAEMTALTDAEGHVCADFVILYPPDVPLIVPGEIYTAEKVSEIMKWIRRGFSVMGVDG